MKKKSIIKLNLPSSVAQRIDQGGKVVTMSKTVLTGTQPLIDALDTANTNLATLQAAALQAKQASAQAFAAVQAAGKVQAQTYGNLANHVSTVSEGDASFILSTGYGVRATPAPVPSPTAPDLLRARMGKDPGTILVQWKAVIGAKVYAAEYSTDLSGTGTFTAVDETPSAARLLLSGLESGTVYLIRVCALANGYPGPFAAPVQQMAP
ncbi:MAG: fibronectin type III domain-containing protein [Chthoniobacterales bacterium]